MRGPNYSNTHKQNKELLKGVKNKKRKVHQNYLIQNLLIKKIGIIIKERLVRPLRL
jgi:hypothetical protein